MSDPFAAIRPFNDEEVRPAIDRLLDTPEFLTALLRFRLGRVASYGSWFLRPLLRFALTRRLREVHNVDDFQMAVKGYLERMIEDTSAGFTVSGLERLDSTHAHLFISNHRDIAMDPAFTNYALHLAGHDTLRIAIGDNLLSEAWVADLMRLNKSFVVQRSISAPRELLTASRLLSNYIRSSIQRDNVPIWIAQREGRAKDGIDRTEPAVIKMLSLSRDRKSEEFGEHIASLRIVPVAISYELDPCDAMKARELSQREASGSYEKEGDEDVLSIGRGISGDKGRVHVSFGTPLGADLESPEAVAAAIDEQIIQGYQLHPVNLWAHERLGGDGDVAAFSVAEGSCSEAEFDARMAALSDGERQHALAAYANAARSKLELAARQ